MKAFPSVETADLSLAADAAHAVNPWVALAYLAAGVLFILALTGALFAPIGAHGQDKPKIELSHFMSAYSVADIEAVTKFYVDVLDFEVVKDVPLGEAMHFRWLRNGNQGIELVQMANSQPGPERGTPPAAPSAGSSPAASR